MIRGIEVIGEGLPLPLRNNKLRVISAEPIGVSETGQIIDPVAPGVVVLFEVQYIKVGWLVGWGQFQYHSTYPKPYIIITDGYRYWNKDHVAVAYPRIKRVRPTWMEMFKISKTKSPPGSIQIREAIAKLAE